MCSSEALPFQNLSNFSISISFGNTSDDYNRVEDILYSRVVPFICTVGLVGNLFNLLILCRKSLTCHMGRMERAAHIGLLALACSDFMFCLVTLPTSILDNVFYHQQFSFSLLYNTYSAALINTFLLCSTWLTVILAISRYLAICFPLWARQHIGLKCSRLIILLVYVISVLFNLPRFWLKVLEKEECDGEGYFIMPGPMRKNKSAEMIYQWSYFILGLAIPLFGLAYCNIYLIRALRASNKLRNEHRSSVMHNNKNIITLTLSVIIALYIILVAPAEVLTFWKHYINPDSTATSQFSLAVAFCNTFQTVNFAINFILYCIINVHFRRVVLDALSCKGKSYGNYERRVSLRSSMLTTNTITTSV